MTSICAECGATVASMPQHMKIHDKREFECEVCDQLVVGRTNFVNHKQTHKNWTCPKCHNFKVKRLMGTPKHLEKSMKSLVWHNSRRVGMTPPEKLNLRRSVYSPMN